MRASSRSATFQVTPKSTRAPWCVVFAGLNKPVAYSKTNHRPSGRVLLSWAGLWTMPVKLRCKTARHRAPQRRVNSFAVRQTKQLCVEGEYAAAFAGYGGEVAVAGQHHGAVVKRG